MGGDWHNCALPVLNDTLIRRPTITGILYALFSAYMMSMPDPIQPASKPCPTCGKPAEPKFLPFCSRRCADVDLQRWFSGKYAAPVVAEDAEEESLPFDLEDE